MPDQLQPQRQNDPQPLPPDIDPQPPLGDPPNPGLVSPFLFDPDGMYVSISIGVFLFVDGGLRMAPTAGPQGSLAVFWRCHGGLAVKVVQFDLWKFLSPPVPPSLAPANANEVYLNHSFGGPYPDEAPDGNYGYRLTGSILYGLQQVPSSNDPFVWPQSIIQVAGFQQVTIPASWNPNIVAPWPAPQGFSGGMINF